MTQATERNSKPNQAQPQPQTSTSTPSSAAQVAAEIGQIRAKVDRAVGSQKSGIETLADEYTKAVQPLVDEASEVIYDMLSGRSFFEQIGQNVGQLMSSHPTMERPELGKPTLKRLSFKPLPQATPQSYLSSAKDETEA